MNHQSQQNSHEELQKMLSETINPKKQTNNQDKPDQQCQKLIADESEEMQQNNNNSSQQSEPNAEPQIDIIDPLIELVKNNNVVPLLAVIDMLDLTQIVEGKPLLSRLCTMHLPLNNHLKNRQIKFVVDDDHRTALHQAIQADDTLSAHWCLKQSVGNIRDNFGNTPILEAIRLGRKSCFLLCLQYQYFDESAAHICAKYNRVWQLKVLHRLGFDIVSVHDSSFSTPLETAVANYSYQAAEYLSQISSNVSITDLATKTDSKGIIRLIKNIRQKNSKLNSFWLPIAYPLTHLLVIYVAISTLQIYQNIADSLKYILIIIAFCYGCLVAFGCKGQKKHTQPNLMNLLKAPQFPVLQEICPECLQFQNTTKDHCRKCDECVSNHHFHSFICVSSKNEVFWFLIEILWYFLAYHLLQTWTTQTQLQNLVVLNFSNNFFFAKAIIIQKLWESSILNLCWFLYLNVFALYQFFCCFQWLAMMVLSRSFREINNTQKYRRLYRLIKMDDGCYKSQQIRIMERGICPGIKLGVTNAVGYFFR